MMDGEVLGLMGMGILGQVVVDIVMGLVVVASIHVFHVVIIVVLFVPVL